MIHVRTCPSKVEELGHLPRLNLLLLFVFFPALDLLAKNCSDNHGQKSLCWLNSSNKGVLGIKKKGFLSQIWYVA